MKSSTNYFHVKTKILADFQIRISVPLLDQQNANTSLKLDKVLRTCQEHSKADIFEEQKY